VLLSNTNNSTLTVGEAGNYKLIVDLGNNCKDTSNVIATELYPSPQVGFTINNPTQCVNANLFSLVDTTKIGSGTFSRVWTWDNNSSSQESLDLSFNTVGAKSIKLKATSNNGCSDSLVKTVLSIIQHVKSYRILLITNANVETIPETIRNNIFILSPFF
jgi:PKD repeat protein